MKRALVLTMLMLGACGKDSKDDDPKTSTTNPLPDGPLNYVPVAQWDNYPFEDKAVRLYIPPDPIGVVFFSHGTNGNVSIVNQMEPVAFLNELIGVGIGFVATDSGDQPGGKWIDGDVERVGRLYQHVIDTTELEATDHLFTAGFSGGGNMAGNTADYAVEQGWPIRAISVNQSGCIICRDLALPTVWVVNENDTPPHQTAQDGHDELVAAGVAADLHHVDEKILTGESFLKHPDMNEERAQRVFDDMVAKLLIDAQGVRIVPDDEADQWCTWYGNNGESFGPEGRGEELRVLWALHRFSAEPAREMRNFFLDAI